MIKSADKPTTKSSKSGKVLRAAGWLFAAREFSPKYWLTGSYKRGAVFKTALDNAKSLIPGKKEYRKETFAQACARLNLSEADLQMRHRESVLTSRCCYLISLITLSISFFYAFDGNATSCIGGLAVTCVALTCAAKSAYLAWRISIRRLAHPREFVRNPDAWIV